MNQPADRCCRNCRWWTERVDGVHYCELTNTETRGAAWHTWSQAQVDGWEGGVLVTTPDFGCRQWNREPPDA